MLKVILSFCCVLFLQFGYAQLGDPNTYLNSLKLIPATPEAAQFQKYGDIPVDYQTGVPSIQVPVYTIKMHQFEWPVSLSYHSGGFKVDEVASNVGLGWTLNAGGMISSRVFGLPDITKPNDLNDPILKDAGLTLPVYYPPSEGQSLCSTDFEDYENFADNDLNGGWNHLPDLFYYNFGNNNGKMFLKNGKGYSLPVNNLKVIYSNGEWQVTDEKGNKYHFKPLGYNETSSVCAISTPPLGTQNKNFVLYKIITYNNETIDFNYTTYNYQYTSNKSYTVNEKDNSDPTKLTPCASFTPPANENCDNIYSAIEARLNEIVTSNGCRIRFAYSSRTDISGGQKLDSIRVETTSGQIVRWVNLKNSYFGTVGDQNLRLKLDSIHDLDRTGQVISKTRLYYNSTVLPARLSNAQDSAGYFNGQTGNTTLIPQFSNRSFSETHTKACILEKIQFPTGGYSLFTYERNSGGLGGLRIKKVESKTDDVSQPVVKEYVYGNYLSPSTTFQEHVPVYVDYTTPMGGGFTNHAPTECFYYRYTSDGYQNLENRYRNNGIQYYQVTEMHGAEGINGKNEYKYARPVFYSGTTDIGPANLVETNTYSKEGAAYKLLKKVKSVYEYDIDNNALMFGDSSTNPLEARIYGIEFKKLRKQANIPVGNCTTPNLCLAFCLDDAYEWSHVLLISNPLRLIENEERLYANENGGVKDSIVIKNTYQYSISLLSPTKVITTRSDAQSKEVQTWYPTQKLQISGLTAGQKTALDSLVANNILTQGVYSETKVATNLTGKSQLIYELFNNKSLVSKVRQAPSGGSDWVEAEIVSYDANGKVLEVKEPSGLYSRFTYDNLNNYVIAQTQHGSTIVSAFTSFEADATGSWSIASSSRTTDGVTGTKCYQLSNGAVSKNGLTVADSYTLSYWTKNGTAFTITGTQGTPVQGRTANGWTFFTHTISGVSQVTISGTGLIDELRLYSKNAQMTTFTYEPLVGITAQCDVANKISYYEYDAFGRLKVIRDMDGNIIKTMEYHFRGQ